VVTENGGSESIFSPQALEKVFMFSQGVPRLINYICDSALLSGFVYERPEIDDTLMTEVIHESQAKAQDAADAVVTYCCEKCQFAHNCATKWIRAEHGKEQLCCELCRHYKECHPSGGA